VVLLLKYWMNDSMQLIRTKYLFGRQLLRSGAN
jgi:hypothetical protein